ncbi:MAG: OmpA family protein [Spirochaetales bacterium]|nr:OmpA family protein [Spirochaetales bacterium]
MHIRKKVVCVIFMLCFVIPAFIYSQQTFEIQFIPGEKFKLTERHDLSKRVNGSYQGYIYREVRGVLTVAEDETGQNEVYQGKFYVLEEMKRETRHVARRIDKTIESRFRINSDGHYVIHESQAYPLLRGFPVFPKKAVTVGEKWRAYGMRIVEPLHDGVFTRVPFYCEYEYKGKGMYNGVECDVIQAQYAMRYKAGDDVYGDERIRNISGKHVVTIYFDSEGKRPQFMRDLVEETYMYDNGTEELYKGFILTWFDMIVVMDRDEIKKDIIEELEDSNIPDIVVEEREEGVALTLNKIHFIADKAVVKPEEYSRLDALVEALKKIEGRTFLVVGHTARWGSEESQYTLSVERAKTIVDYLVSKGIPAERFLYEGRGATEPVASNDTEEGMAQNRRVEIIILED